MTPVLRKFCVDLHELEVVHVMHDELFAAQLELDDPLARLNVGRTRMGDGLLPGRMPICSVRSEGRHTKNLACGCISGHEWQEYYFFCVSG